IASNRETTGTGWTRRNRRRGHPRARLPRPRIAARRRPQNPRGPERKDPQIKASEPNAFAAVTARFSRPLAHRFGGTDRDRPTSPGPLPNPRPSRDPVRHKYYTI